MRLLLAGFFTLVLAAPATAADITVNTRADTVDDDGRCSLREAVTAANTGAASGGQTGECAAGEVATDVILLGDGHHVLSRAGAREDGNATGDLDVLDAGPLTVRGTGGDRTVVSGDGLDRVLDVLAGAGVTIADLAIVGGAAPDGADGAAAEGSPGEHGGGIRSDGRLELRDSVVRGNRAGRGGRGGAGLPGGRGGDGGGIYSLRTLTLVRTQLVDNRAGTAGPAGDAFLAGNSLHPGGSGGGIAGFGITTLADSLVQNNRAGSGGIGGSGTTGAGLGGGGGDGGGLLLTVPSVIQTSRIAGNTAGDGARGGDASLAGGNGGGGGDGGGVFATAALTLTGVVLSGNSTGEGGAGGDGSLNAGDGGAGGSGAGLVGVGAAGVTVESSTFTGGVLPRGGPPGQGMFGQSGVAGFATAAAGAGPVSLARTLTDGTCGGFVNDGGGNLGTDFSCPVTLASLFLDANGMPGPGSHAIDAVSSCPPVDLAGTARPQGARCDVGALEVPAAPLAVARTGLGFGSVSTGTAMTRSVDVSNPGLPALPLAISVTGDSAFTLDGHTCGAALGGGEDCAVTVRFAPTATGAQTGWLEIGGETLALTGTGVAPPSDPAPVDPQNNPPQATARCVVPRLKGKTPIAAARALQKANCKLGKVTRRGRGRPGRVRSFSPKAGTSLPAGATVRLVLNRRPTR